MAMDASPTTINARLQDAGIIGGYVLGKDYPDLPDSLLLCVTEMNRKSDMDRLVSILSTASSGVGAGRSSENGRNGAGRYV